MKIWTSVEGRMKSDRLWGQRPEARDATREMTPGDSFATALVTVLAVLALVALPAAAEEELEVLLMMPTYGEAVFGDLDVVAEIYPPETEIFRVEFYLDDQLVGLMEKPPFSQVIDVGQENVEHHFQVQVYAVSGAVANSSVRTPKIKTNEEISVDLQQLFITVKRGDQRALDLERSDFAVFDNGARQQTVTFERGDVPFTATILVDASSSMKGRRLQIAIKGAETFVRGMKEHDQAKLMLMSDRVLYETPFTSFASVLAVGLAGVEADGGTALNDHLYLAMKRLEKRQGRRVVVFLSDGIDVESALSMQQVQWMANQHQPVIYWIRLGTASNHRSSWRGVLEHEQEIEDLKSTVEESGGRIETIQGIEEVEQAFQSILEDLRNQYVIGYYPSVSARGEMWHKILVRVRDSSLDVRTRGGYLESTSWTSRRRRGSRGR
jgi:VWFA-related protein